jgi:hypothetical protein
MNESPSLSNVTLMLVILSFQIPHTALQSTELKNNPITKGFRQNLDTWIEARFQKDFKTGKKHFKLINRK